jgi:hypothetical protein
MKKLRETLITVTADQPNNRIRRPITYFKDDFLILIQPIILANRETKTEN